MDPNAFFWQIRNGRLPAPPAACRLPPAARTLGMTIRHIDAEAGEICVLAGELSQNDRLVATATATAMIRRF